MAFCCWGAAAAITSFAKQAPWNVLPVRNEILSVAFLANQPHVCIMEDVTSITSTQHCTQEVTMGAAGCRVQTRQANSLAHGKEWISSCKESCRNKAAEI